MKSVHALAIVLSAFLLLRGELIIGNDEVEEGAWFSDWILISAEPSSRGPGAIADAATPWDSTSYRVIRPWTDEHSNLISVFKTPENKTPENMQ